MQELTKILWETNYNGKMACNGIVHIDFPPRTKYTYEELQKLPNIIIETEDASHEPIEVKIINLIYIPLLQKIPSVLTLASHGVEETQFVEYLFKEFPTQLQYTKELCVWFYLKQSKTHHHA